MGNYKLTDTELKFAEIIWSNEPISSPDLVKICESELAWKKSTTYTMLKKLENKGVVQNIKGIVISLIDKEQFYSEQSNQFVEDTFEGSLPKFLAAFIKKKKLNNKEIEEIQKLINDYREE